MPKKKRPKPKLGSNLEWNGPTIRVVIKVPPSRRATVGSAHLRESLGTNSPMAAETLKWPVIRRLKARAQGTEEFGQTPRSADRLTAEAVKWRSIIAAASEPDALTPSDELADRAEEIEEEHGPAAAARFFGIASGKATPVRLHVERWLGESSIAPRTVEKWRRSIAMLEAWAASSYGSGLTIEVVTKRTVADFISESMIHKDMNPATANSYISGLRAYWKWLVDGGLTAENPWLGASRPKAKASDPTADKRPFTDGEVLALLTTIKKQPLCDLCLVAALSGMRLNEIASLRVSNVVGDMIRLTASKTKAGRRLVPIHSGLRDLISGRMKDKAPTDFLFHELPDQKNPARPRAAPMTQAFTYARRSLGVDVRVDGVRQSGVDFHSWRRWFIRKAADALDAGASGFSQWTISEVVGHSKGDGPLAMTMGRYAGNTSAETLRRCVESVKLPSQQPPSGDDC